ncbi:hypothetical protein [Ruegeria halocynthiae]|uniref:hypothetical protein n=1 Tax=Ruegeria halocynthiae TaxID=985054 RepID=UPI000ACD3D66|nr:hypothetical protein [Ruegeria halocynthiae]
MSSWHPSYNQLIEDDTYRYGYDLRGNRISRTHKVSYAVETYTYDWTCRGLMPAL